MRKLMATVLALLLLEPGVAEVAPGRGTLLVAAPTVTDREFAQTVVLLLHHGEDGSLGLIVNRPTALAASELLADRLERKGYDEPVFIGGPVAPTAVAILAHGIPGAGDAGSGAQPVLEDLYVHSDLTVLADLPPREARARIRLYAGHTAWQAGQLEAELARGEWQLVAGSASAAFTAAPLELWRSLLRLEGETLVEQRTAPRDISARLP